MVLLGSKELTISQHQEQREQETQLGLWAPCLLYKKVQWTKGAYCAMIEKQYYGTEVYKDIIRSAIDGHINWCWGRIHVSKDAPDKMSSFLSDGISHNIFSTILKDDFCPVRFNISNFKRWWPLFVPSINDTLSAMEL